jgi:hypothetical protein
MSAIEENLLKLLRSARINFLTVTEAFDVSGLGEHINLGRLTLRSSHSF